MSNHAILLDPHGRTVRHRVHRRLIGELILVGVVWDRGALPDGSDFQSVCSHHANGA